MQAEQLLIDAMAALRECGDDWTYGYQLAKAVRCIRGGKLLMGHGTLYRALGRLEKAGRIESRWEGPLEADGYEQRPRRKYYRLISPELT